MTLKERLVSQLTAKGISKTKAVGIAVRKLQQSGNLDMAGNPTAQGLYRGDMTPAQRAVHRAVKERGGDFTDYKYNSLTNKAVKKYKY